MSATQQTFSVGNMSRLDRIKEKIDQGLDIGPLNAHHLVVRLENALGEISELKRTMRSLEFKLARQESKQN